MVRLGALVQCDFFADQLPGVATRCVGDAGVFLDAASLSAWPAAAAGEHGVPQRSMQDPSSDVSRDFGVMAMQFGNTMRMQNLSMPWRCLASAANTFPAACFFPQHVLHSAVTPRFIRNSFYNYGEFEMLPVWERPLFFLPPPLFSNVAVALHDHPARHSEA